MTAGCAAAGVLTGGTKSRGRGRAGPGIADSSGTVAVTAGAVTTGAGSGSTRGCSVTGLVRSGGTNFLGSGRAGLGINASRFGNGVSRSNVILGAGCQINCLPGCAASTVITWPGRLNWTFGFPALACAPDTSGNRSLGTYQTSFSLRRGMTAASRSAGGEVGMAPIRITSAMPQICRHTDPKTASGLGPNLLRSGPIPNSSSGSCPAGSFI